MAKTGRSILRGAFLLSFSSIICKILGAAYRIPLVRLIGDEGIGLYQMAYPVYLVFIALSTAGMPLAISRLVAERIALGDRAGVGRVLRLAIGALGGLGLFGGFLMSAGARFFSLHVAADPRAYPVILSLAPAVPLMALMAALRGFFQGGQDMLPSATSQLVEQVVRVATLLALAVLLLPSGIQWAAAGAAFGATAGGAAGFTFLVWWYFTHPWTSKQEHETHAASYWMLAKRLGVLALPIAVGTLLLPLMQAIDSVMVPIRLQAIGYDLGRAAAALGQLGNAWATIYVPTAITAALATSLVPAVTETWTRQEREVTLYRIVQSLRLAAIVCLPAAAGLWALAGEICQVLYGAGSAAGSLRALAPAAFFLGLQGVCSGALQGLGRPVAPVRNLALGFLLKVILTGVLCLNPVLGPRGAALGTAAGSALAAALSLWELARRVGLPLSIFGALAKSGAAAGVMILALRRLGAALPFIFWPAFFRLLIMLPLGILIFGLTLWLVGGVEDGDGEVLRHLTTLPPHFIRRLFPPRKS